MEAPTTRWSHVPMPGGHMGELPVSGTQSLGCRFGSSSPGKDSAELLVGEGARSQHLLRSPETGPAGGPRESLHGGCIHGKQAGPEPAHISQPTDAGWPVATTLLPQRPQRLPQGPLWGRPEEHLEKGQQRPLWGSGHGLG